MFRIELSNNQIIKDAFESIHKIVKEITLTADSEALHLKCLSQDHITFIMMDLNKTLFDSYQCDTPEKISIDCSEFMKILKLANKNDLFEMNTEEDKLNIIYHGDSKRKFSIKQIDVEYDNPQPPQVDLPVSLPMKSTLLKQYIDNLSVFSDKLKFIVTEDYLKLITDGTLGEGEIEYLHGENINTVFNVMFSIPKLQELMQSVKFSKNCTLELGDDKPLLLTFKLPTNDGELKFLLAPRLEESE